MTPTGFMGITRVNELLKYTIVPTEADELPINRLVLLNRLAQLVRMRAQFASDMLHKNKVHEAGMQIALAQVYLGLIEHIREGKYD